MEQTEQVDADTRALVRVACRYGVRLALLGRTAACQDRVGFRQGDIVAERRLRQLERAPCVHARVPDADVASERQEPREGQRGVWARCRLEPAGGLNRTGFGGGSALL